VSPRQRAEDAAQRDDLATAAGSCPEGRLTPCGAGEALATTIEAERLAPRMPGPGMAFAAVAEAYVTYLRVEKQRKPSTIQDARNVIRATLVPRYGAETRVETIATADVDALRITLLEAGRAPRTVQKTMVIGHGIFSLARRRGWIPENPATAAEKIQLRDDDAFNILSPEQFELVYAAAVRADGSMAGLQLSLAFYLGLRQGEIMDLPWGAVDFGRKLVHVGSNFTHGQRGTPKGGRVRSVPLPDLLADRLRAERQRPRFTDDRDFVITNSLGNRVSDDFLRDGFYDALYLAGMGFRREDIDSRGEAQTRIVYHDLPHSWCSWAVNVWPIHKVKEFAGHRDVSTTMRYVHLVHKTEDADAAGAYLATLAG
jgi:integrase